MAHCATASEGSCFRSRSAASNSFTNVRGPTWSVAQTALPAPIGQVQRDPGIDLECSRSISKASFSSVAGPTASGPSSSLVCISGRVGLWKDIFTVSMNEKFDLVYKQKMGKCDLTFDFYL